MSAAEQFGIEVAPVYHAAVSQCDVPVVDVIAKPAVFSSLGGLSRESDMNLLGTSNDSDRCAEVLTARGPFLFLNAKRQGAATVEPLGTYVVTQIALLRPIKRDDVSNDRPQRGPSPVSSY